jgi:CheY-like chemotaxis protein
MKTVTGAIKILHLEDMPEDAMIINRAIKAILNCEILVVDNRVAFIQQLRRFLPHIILSDHSLPHFTSLEALAILKYAGHKIPFILVSGTTDEKYIARLMEEGMDDYISKDRLDRLPAAILSLVKQYS